jgi:hypothetical protein
MDKTPTTEMNLSDLGTAITKMSDADLNAAYQAEKAAGPDKERKGAISAIEKAAKDRNLTLTDPTTKPDGELAAEVAGAQPAGPNATEEEREEHRKMLEAMDKRVSALEANPGAVPDGKEFNARTEILRIHAGLEYLANHMNLKLPRG